MTDTQSESEGLLTEIPFSQLDLMPALQQGLADAGFSHCTPIQAKALPQALQGIDVEGQAQTGTGKTAAFLLATMNHLMRTEPPPGYRAGDPRALILAPTRELAVQIHQDALRLGAHTGLRTGVAFGGTGYEQQREMIAAGLDILIGTPGRLIDYHKQQVYRLISIQVVVLDEADRMFDLGFIRDIRFMLRRLPPPAARLNMLFSATLSQRVSELAYEHLNAPVLVNATPPGQVTVDRVRQAIYHVAKEEKIALLVGLLRQMPMTRTLIFTNTKHSAERVAAYLKGNGFHAGVLTGDIPQRIRLRLFNEFLQGELPILAATDVAARELHIPDVSHVINFDLPQDPEDYVHRIGRTARVGAYGNALSFACEEYVFALEAIEDFIGNRIPVEPVSGEMLPALKHPKPATGGTSARHRSQSTGNRRKR